MNKCIFAGAALVFLRLVQGPVADGPPTANQVLLLTNERTVSGQIEQVGNRYRIRRDVGETWIPASSVLKLCVNHEEAYTVLRKRANLTDVDERMRLARWCHLHGLRKQAIDEATASVAMQPNNAACRKLLQACQRVPSAYAPNAEIRVVSAEIPVATPNKPDSTPAVGPELMTQFITRAQPVLMNACVSCHSSESSGSFKLTRATDRGTLNRFATQENLKAVLAQVNYDSCDKSPLLDKAIAAHGQAAEAPIKNRQAAAFRNLEDWVRGVVTKSRPQPAVVEPKPLAEPPIEVRFPPKFGTPENVDK